MRATGLIVVVGFALAAGAADRPARDTAAGTSKAERSASAAAWPVFRGNARQTGVAPAPLPDRLAVRWTFKAKDAVEATAAIANGVVYVGSFDENLYALDLKTGREKWRFKAGPVKVAPAVRGGAVYVGNMDGVFHCVDAATGQGRWKFDTGSEITSAANFAGDTVLFGAGDESLYCLTLGGQKRWNFKVPGGPVLGSPAVVGDRTFVSGCDSALHVLDVATGKQFGEVGLGGQTCATVAALGDDLYVGTMSNQFLGIDWKKGQVLWQFQSPNNPQPFYASAAATADLVVAASRDRRVYGLDRKTGQQAWSFATRGKVDSSPVVAGKRVYVGSADGNLYVLDLALGTEVERHDLGKGGEGITASPAVADGMLVIGTVRGMVYGLGAKN